MLSAPALPYSRAEQRGWYFYDWANSAFPTIVVTTFFGPFLTALAKAAADADGRIYPFGIPVDPRSLWGYTVALSVICQVLLLPPIGAIADRGRHKKTLLFAFAYCGAFATACMFFLGGGRYLMGAALFLVANVSFGAANVIYNSYLPEIAPVEERDAVSSRGWGIGYLGGGLALALNLGLYLQAEKFGITEGQAVRISLASAGIWWALFSLIPLARLRKRARTVGDAGPRTGAAFQQLFRTIGGLRQYPQTMLFIGAYLLYNDAIQAVISLAGQFAVDELKVPLSKLTMAILMVQFVAVLGSIAFAKLAEKLSAKGAIMVSLVIWTGAILYVYLAVRTVTDFFIMAAIVGVVMGGSQALSRSLYSTMIPKGKEAEYFSLYEVSDKGTSWMAPLIFGLTLQWTGSYRLAILTLIVFFLSGLALLSRVDARKASADALA